MKKDNYISLFYARESVPNLGVLHSYFKNFDDIRKKCDVELVVINRTFINNQTKNTSHKRTNVSCYKELIEFVHDNLRIGGIAIMSSMNDLSVKNVEYGDDSVEVSIKNSWYGESFRDIYDKNKKDPLNSFLECKQKQTMDMVLYYDSLKDCLYEWHRKNDWMSHGYVRGLGFFVSSHLESIRDVIQEVCHTARDGMNLWENWYGHTLDKDHFREIDLDSGFMRIVKVENKDPFHES